MKKGQITVFVIIGIILIVAIGLVMYAQRETILAPVEAERITQAKVPQTVQPIQSFVRDCLFVVSKQGLEILGGRAGYIDPKQRFNPFEPTAGEAVQFAPDSELKIPYWWHMSARNDCAVGACTFKSERPALYREEGRALSIEGQLDSYVKENLPGCLRDFTQFKEQQFTITAGQIKPTTEITARNVIVLLEMPLEITRADEKHSMKDFVTELPVNLQQIYEISTNITNLQAEHGFLERATRALIDVFGRLDENALPPVSEIEIDFGGGTVWTKFDVEQKIKEMLASYIPLLKVTYTGNYKYLYAPRGKDDQMFEALYNRGFVVPVLTPHKNLNVRFTYLPWWKPYLDMNCNGQLCQADGFSSTFAFLLMGVQRYNFAYDISYPVLVEVTDPDAFGGEGYSFRYFLEANMRNNEPLAIMEPPLTVVQAGSKSLLCDPAQRTGGNITVNVETSAGEPVDDAEVLYRCGTETCRIGPSANGRIVAPFPHCLGGILSATHFDYASAVKPVDVLDASAQTIDLVMGAPYEVDFKVKKWLLKKQLATVSGIGGVLGDRSKYSSNWELDTSQPVNQGPRESTIIMLTREGEEFEEPIIVFGDVCGAPVFKAKNPCGEPPEDNSKDVTIYPGEYRVTIYSFLYPAPDVTIPPDRRCFSYKTGTRRKTKCYMVPTKPIVFGNGEGESPLFSGYAEFDWTVTDNDLLRAKAIEFKYINFALEKVRPPKERKIEDLEIMGNLFSYSEQYQYLLKPTIIT